jgi:hypothetical protein
LSNLIGSGSLWRHEEKRLHMSAFVERRRNNFGKEAATSSGLVNGLLWVDDRAPAQGSHAQ